MLTNDNDGSGPDKALRGAPEDPEKDLQSYTRRSVRRVLDVREGTVRSCTWNGVEPRHAHLIRRVAPGAVVSGGDDVLSEALGNFVAHHWYRRVGDKCLPARGDGTLYDEPVKAN